MVLSSRAAEKVTVLDSRETAPAAATVNMFDGDAEASSWGGRSVAVPAEIHGYVRAHDAYGKLNWTDLFDGAIKLSRDGFPVGMHLSQAIQPLSPVINDYPGLKDLLWNPDTNELYKENEIMKNKLLSETLEKVAKDRNSILEGQIAKDLASDIQENNGSIEMEEMRDYKVLEKEPLKIHLLSNYTLYTVPLPGGGPVLGLILNILQFYNLTEDSVSSLDSTVLTTHRMLEAFKFAFAKRMEMGDLQNEIMAQLIKNITSTEYAKAVYEKIYDNRTFDDPSYYGVQFYADEDHGTAHVSVISPNGDAVSVTSTINAYFGSKVRSLKTGIILNNEMDDFSSPNITNIFNVPPSVPNYIEPGKRPMSSMCPSIILDQDGNVKLAVGAAGGTHILTSVALTILRHLYFGDNIKEAIDAPRIHHQLFPNESTYEHDFPRDILNGLELLGHTVSELTGRGGVVQAVSRGHDNRLYSNADYRKQGATDGF